MYSVEDIALLRRKRGQVLLQQCVAGEILTAAYFGPSDSEPWEGFQRKLPATICAKIITSTFEQNVIEIETISDEGGVVVEIRGVSECIAEMLFKWQANRSGFQLRSRPECEEESVE